MMAPDMPFDPYRDVVRPEWIDDNGHMNVGYYGVVFDYATDAFLDHLGLGKATKDRLGIATFTLEAHFTYQREVMEGEALRFTTQLLDYDAKRLHYFHRMWRERDGVLAATNELVSLHVSQETRRAAPSGEEALERLAALRSAHRELPKPREAGRVMGLRSGSTTGRGHGGRAAR